jgi:D-alanine--poly(phosphoribitol) ligase subunit 1
MPYHHNLGSLFSEVVSRYRKLPALRYYSRSYSYSELDEYADRLTVLLYSRGCRRGDVIAIGHDKYPLSYALMLACLRLGIPYVNVDVASPSGRTQSILKMSGASLLFFDNPAYREAMEKLSVAHCCPLVFLEENVLPEMTEEKRQELLDTRKQVDGSSIAYIMFTSGSTGVPKGVAVTHQNVLHFISWGRERFDITERDNFANLSPMYFDNSVFDFYVGLFSGASLSPISRELITQPYELVPYVSELACTIWFSVPSLLMFLMTMKAITPGALPGLRTILFGGEGYPKVELKKLYDRFAHQAMLINVYGPTECTCICSGHTLTADDFMELGGLPTLGHLNPNFDYRILDENDRDAFEGELCLIGPNVAAGYFNDLERTAAAFFTITDSNRFMKRMYRTGDHVKEVSGQLHFLGRKDNQIKRMGYRIELEEIENALVRLPQVDQAAVVYLRKHAAYGKLVACIACAYEVTEKKILQGLSQFLPNYMLPDRLIFMPHLPKNANGKVDRQMLLTLVNVRESDKDNV